MKSNISLRQTLFYFISSLGTMGGFATEAWAIDTLTPGLGLGGADEFTTLISSETRPFNIAVEAKRSYECIAQSVFTSTSSPSLSLYDPLGNPADVSQNSIAERGDVVPILKNLSSSKAVRLCFSPASTGVYSLRLSNDLFASNPIKLRCMETTLYGGFNTNANPYNFLELTNLTAATIRGRIIAYNFDGSEVLNAAFTLEPNRRFDTDIHSAAGPNKYGSLFVTHDGPLGAIEGNVSQYRGPVSGLSLSASVPLSIREQVF